MCVMHLHRVVVIACCSGHALRPANLLALFLLFACLPAFLLRADHAHSGQHPA
jgi:hypothetical protein